MSTSSSAPKPELRRSVTPWGSFSWGYSDVGADIFVGLGLVLAWAAGASNVAFLFAGVVYVCIGLAYTELAATYPVAGGGQYFVMRGLGDIFGFIAGWAVLLDFTIDVTLFAWTSVDYTSQLAPALVNSVHPWLHFIVVLGLVIGLCLLNVVGVRESTAFNGVVSALDVISETCILCFGFLFAFRPQLLIHTMQMHWPSPYELMLGTSLAIISFVGLESISQAAQETQRPASIIPRTSVALILTILIFALAYSNLALGLAAMASDHRFRGPPDAILADLSAERGQSRKGGRAARRSGSLLRSVRSPLRSRAGRGALADLFELGRLRQLAHRLRDEQQQPVAVTLPAREPRLPDAGDLDRLLLRDCAHRARLCRRAGALSRGLVAVRSGSSTGRTASNSSQTSTRSEPQRATRSFS